MATKAEIIKELKDLGVENFSSKDLKADLQTLLEDAKAAAIDAEETAAESPPAEFQIKQTGQIRTIEFGEDEGSQTCTVTLYNPSGYEVGLQIFTAQSYDDMLVSLETWLKEERRRWR